MSGRGRDRFRRDYPPRSEEYHGRNNVPPSRHLWVGNLPLNITEKVIANHFLRFGEIENIAFQPGRSYVFINFRYDEEAFAAVSALQGFEIGGKHIKIEFAKADKSSSTRHEDSFQRRDGVRSEMRESPSMFSRTQHPSPDHKRKMSEKDSEPSEVLWIGFPAQLRIDEEILRKAFSPFGEIEKITAFQGRSYAFVRYRDIKSACRAKETLQGKLFGNPRVHICFAKNESGSSNIGTNFSNDPYGRSGFSEDFRDDRNYKGLLGDPDSRSPRYMQSHGRGDPEIMGFDQRRFPPGRETSPRFHDFPPHRSHPADEDDLPEDNLFFYGNKKMKTNSFPTENELPEFSIPGFDQRKQNISRESSGFNPQDRNSELGRFGYKQVPDRVMNRASPYEERGENWGNSYDKFEDGPGSFPLNLVERKKLIAEPHLWKWEGTIAKGGTPVCRARCFPKGKVMDMPLPEFIDCTARTGLDMLAKHYYQAASTWVVFFAPESDTDIEFYNEFMHYLEEKQRAAVAKLDDKTTLFLVPPSEFSEKVLKVPGKLSISGVILRLENSGPNTLPPQNPHINEEPQFLPSYTKPRSPPGAYPLMSSYPNMVNSGVSDQMVHQRQNTSGFDSNFNGKRGPPQVSSTGFDPATQGYHQRQNTSGFDSNFSGKSRPPQVSSTGFDPATQGYNPNMSRVVEETRSSSSMSLSAFQPDQLAQLASSLLGQSSASASLSTGADFRQSNAMSHLGSWNQQPQRPVYENDNQGNSEFSTSQFGQGNLQQSQSASSRDEEQDPQKKLQATLQLAATLLQQIQQAKGT